MQFLPPVAAAARVDEAPAEFLLDGIRRLWKPMRCHSAGASSTPGFPPSGTLDPTPEVKPAPWKHGDRFILNGRSQEQSPPRRSTAGQHFPRAAWISGKWHGRIGG